MVLALATENIMEAHRMVPRCQADLNLSKSDWNRCALAFLKIPELSNEMLFSTASS